MAHSKKSRKVGKIGISKVISPRPVKTRPDQAEGKGKNTSGNKSGTRQNIQNPASDQNNKQKKDAKVGSKKPIDLEKYTAGAKSTPAKVEQTQTEVKYKTPQDELDAIENNTELDALLEKQLEHTLSKSEKAYVDKMTKRYSDLCELMGISVDDDEEENEDSDDPFAGLDAIRLDDFKD